jgi:catechol 2,3-dioxygenase
MSSNEATDNVKKDRPIDSGTSIGHVHLKVAELERSVKFYTEVLGFEITERMGSSAAFLSAGGYHHHIGLNTWESAGGSPPPPSSTGLYHFAILMPGRKELAGALKRLVDHKWPIDGASDHGVSGAIYLRDPDDNGIEIYTDRPRDQWPHDSNGNLIMYTRPLDVDSLMRELEE